VNFSTITLLNSLRLNIDEVRTNNLASLESERTVRDVNVMAYSILCTLLENAKPVPVTRWNLHFTGKTRFLQLQKCKLWRNKLVCCLQVPNLRSQSPSPQIPTQLLELQPCNSSRKVNEVNKGHDIPDSSVFYPA
jgi:hypothetical protein